MGLCYVIRTRATTCRRHWEAVYDPAGGRLDAIDLATLRRLQANARISIQDLASSASLSHSAMSQRLRRLEASGAIRRHVAELDESLFASWSTYLVIAELTPYGRANLHSLEAGVLRTPFVLDCWLGVWAAHLYMRVATRDTQTWELVRAHLDPHEELFRSFRVEVLCRAVKSHGPHPMLLGGEC